MTIKRPSGPTLLMVLLIVLLPALALLQYRWVGQVSDAERERMQRNLRNAAVQFRDTFEDEIYRALLSLQVGAVTARESASDNYSERYGNWLNTATYPQIVASVYLVGEQGGSLALRRWNPTTHVFEPTLWPAAIDRWRPQFEYALREYHSGRLPDLSDAFTGEDSLITMPIRQGGPRPGPRAPSDPVFVFGFTVLHLDMPYLRNQMIPALVSRHFVQNDGDSYRVAVTAGSAPSNVLYASEQNSTIDINRADVTTALFPVLGFYRGIGLGPGPGPGRGPEGPRRDGDNAFADDDRQGRWRLVVQHESGSLEAAVGLVRRRNLSISFGVLLMLTVSIALLTATTRKSQRLAQQQMEFVAGVSHELRTPVAVIRSASENLSSGVVSGDRVKRYGQMLESEARRLSEMVERVLQYAGIESGLGFGARAALAPAEIIESAIDSALPLVGPGEVQVQRDIPPDLPPVLGDAAALRSAVQNLIANAVKYGGRDRWVGIRVQHVRERRKSEVRIAVSDHGHGIPASELPHIFEPFYRGAEALERQIHGNGLGLSLVRRIVQAHGGRVSVSARPGGGTTFTLSLPATAADALPRSVASGEMQVGAHS